MWLNYSIQYVNFLIYLAFSNVSLFDIFPWADVIKNCKWTNVFVGHVSKLSATRNSILALFPYPAFWPCTVAYLYCTIPMPIMPCPAFCPRPALLLLCPLFLCPPALSYPALSYPALSSPALSSPAQPANCPISGQSDRKVLRLIYIWFLVHLQ